MALVRQQGGGLFIMDGIDGLPEIPPIAELFPATRRWRVVKPHGTQAAYRRHYRRREPMCPRCRAWHRGEMRHRRAAARRQVAA